MMFKRHLLLILIAVAGSLFAADYYELPWLTSVAIIALGLVACFGGIRAIISGEVFEGRSRWGSPRFVARHTGVPARLIGVVLLLAGPVLLALGAMEFSGPGRASSFLAGLPDEPYGWPLILGLTGAMVTAMGIARSLSGSAMPKETYYRHVELGIKIGGILFALAGFAMMSLAAAFLLVPGLSTELGEQLQGLSERAVNLAEDWAFNKK